MDSRAVTGRKVLLVEDNSAMQDLIKLVLGQHGHEVEIAGDGASALEALGARGFDVVLSDFHLPDITGLEVVRRFVRDYPDRPRPRFIAITGDVRGLLSDRANCEVFDRVVPKPLDIDKVCQLVEEEAPARPAPPATAPAPGRDGPDGMAERLGFAYLHWPPTGAAAPAMDGIDAILVHEARGLDALWSVTGANLVPVLDATGGLGASADLDVSAAGTEGSSRVRELIDRFHERRAALHADLAIAEEEADRILARMHVAGGRLEARRSARHDGLVAWSTIADPARIGAALGRLSAEGLVRLEFFERVHHCPACGSAKLIVREECPACQSADLSEESYVHHFRCAYQGPESDFAQGDELACPKCRRLLKHFGNDYDRPGLMTRCRTCGGATSEPAVAFVCAACDARAPADAVPARDVHSAVLTEAGETYARAGAAFMGPARRSLRFADLPLEMIVALNKAASAFNADATPFTLGYVALPGLEDLRARSGARAAGEARRLWLEEMRQSLGAGGMVARGTAYDFFLLHGRGPANAAGLLDDATSRAAAALREDPRPTLQLFGPEDIAA